MLTPPGGLQGPRASSRPIRKQLHKLRLVEWATTIIASYADLTVLTYYPYPCHRQLPGQQWCIACSSSLQ